MKLSISGIFQEPNYRFDFSQNYLDLLSNTLKTNVLNQLETSNFQELEIYICTNSQTANRVEKMVQKKPSNYLTFQFWFESHSVVENIEPDWLVKIRLNLFTNIFFDLLKEALAFSTIEIATARNQVLLALEQEPQKYLAQLSEMEKSMRQKVAALRNAKQTVSYK